MSVSVLLTREFIDIHGAHSTLTQEKVLPIPPQSGLGIVLTPDLDPDEIDYVFISTSGKAGSVLI